MLEVLLFDYVEKPTTIRRVVISVTEDKMAKQISVEFFVPTDQPIEKGGISLEKLTLTGYFRPNEKNRLFATRIAVTTNPTLTFEPT